MRFIFFLSMISLSACNNQAAPKPPVQEQPAQPPQAEAPEPAAKATTVAGVEINPEDLYYGVYLNGQKVGWMRTQVVLGEHVELHTDLVASVAGLGSVQKISLIEKRYYTRSDGKLHSMSFEQRAATGVVRISGKTNAGTLNLTITAGGSTSEQTHKVNDNLKTEMATRDLVRRAKIGETLTVSRFDPSVQRTVATDHKVVATEERLFAGVATQTVKVIAKYPELGIEEISWLDQSGKALESKVGGFFVARLEPPDVAKNLDYVQDLLISAVVKTPKPIPDPAKLNKLSVTFKGFGEHPPPSSDRQQVKTNKDQVVLELGHDGPWPNVELGSKTKTDDEYLKATPFIQSDSEDIIAAAKKAVGDAKDVTTAIERLTPYVFSHVKDEYVPAYSNALEALETGRGDCTEHSILFVALARALGIPARVAVGIAYWPAGNGFGWHAWSEVRLNDKWYAVDPTWNQPKADVTHIKLADGGPAQQARIVMLLGSLQVVSVAL